MLSVCPFVRSLVRLSLKRVNNNAIFSKHFHDKSSDVDELWYTTALSEVDDSQMTNCEHF